MEPDEAWGLALLEDAELGARRRPRGHRAGSSGGLSGRDGEGKTGSSAGGSSSTQGWCLQGCWTGIAYGIPSLAMMLLVIVVVVMAVRVDESQERISDLEKKVRQLEARLDHGLEGDSPEGMVVFLGRKECPEGWLVEERAIGRVIEGRNESESKGGLDGGARGGLRWGAATLPLPLPSAQPASGGSTENQYLKVLDMLPCRRQRNATHIHHEGPADLHVMPQP